MHIHPPKPLHGWKEFLNEIVIIVIGVLIALGFEQVVEELHWQDKVHDGEARLKVEARGNFIIAAEQIAIGNCEMAIINRMRRVIAAPDGSTAQVPAYALPNDTWLGAAGDRGNVIPFVPRLYSTSIWSALSEDETLAHFDPERQRLLSGVYAQVNRLDELNRATRASQGELAPLGDGVRLDSNDRFALSQAIGRAETQLRYRLLIAEQLLWRMRALKIAPSDADVNSALKITTKERYGSICTSAGSGMVDWSKAIEPYEHVALDRAQKG